MTDNNADAELVFWAEKLRYDELREAAMAKRDTDRLAYKADIQAASEWRRAIRALAEAAGTRSPGFSAGANLTEES